MNFTRSSKRVPQARMRVSVHAGRPVRLPPLHPRHVETLRQLRIQVAALFSASRPKLCAKSWKIIISSSASTVLGAMVGKRYCQKLVM